MKKRENFLSFSAADLFRYAEMDMNEVYEGLESSSRGLSEKEAEDRLEIFGLNEVKHNKQETWITQLSKAFINPFVVVLMLLAAVSFITDVLWKHRAKKTGQQL